MSEMESFDLAPGDPISQDGSLRAFRYSQFSACPSAPFNTAMPECLPSQFRLSASLATSPILELEDHNSVPLRELSSSLLKSSMESGDTFSKHEGEKCNSEVVEHVQHGEPQFSGCPCASFNTALNIAVPECLPSQFHLSASLTTSPIRELEDHNPVPVREPSSSLLNSSTESGDAFAELEGEKCNSEGAEHLQHGEFFSDSLGLSLFDVYSWSKKRESSPRRACCDHGLLEEEAQVPHVFVSVQQASPVHSPIQDSPRRIYCDPRFLDEETQVSDVGLLSSKQQASCLLSPKQHLQVAPQAFDSAYAISEISASVLRKEETESILTTAAEPEKSLPTTAVKQGCRAVEDCDDVYQRWHSRRTEPDATSIPSSSADYFQGQPISVPPVNTGLFSANQMTPAAVKEDAAIVPKPHDRRRISPSSYMKLSLLANTVFPMEPKQEIITPSTSDADHIRCQPPFLDPENVSRSTVTNQDIVAAIDDADIVQRWHNRKRVALSATSSLSSFSDSVPCKKLKQTPENVDGSCTVHSGSLQSQLVDDENLSVPRHGHARPENETSSPRSGSETTEEDVNVNDDADDCCDSKLIRRELKYSRARGIKSFLQVATARHEPAISSSNEFGVSKPEQAEKKWTYPRKNRPGGRQRTMDAWIK